MANKYEEEQDFSAIEPADGLLAVSEDVPVDDSMIELDDESPSEEEMEAIRADLLLVAESILKSRTEAVQFRAQSGIEKWWRLCEESLDYSSDLELAPSMIDRASGNAPIVDNSKVKRSRVVMNLIRGRCEVSVGRFEDILLPVRSKNWAFKITPNVDILKMEGDTRTAMGPNGKPVMLPGKEEPATMDQVGRHLRAKAEKAMAGMERVVHDALCECNFNSEERKVIENAVQLGTGILKGPCNSRKLKKVWKKSVSKDPTKPGKTVPVRVLHFQEDQKPISVSVSPWNVYPTADCGQDVAKASGIWEKDTIRPRDVQRLIGLPGYKSEQLEMVLQEEPKRLNVAVDERGNLMRINIDNASMGEVYELWEYNGEVKPEYMRILGCDCPNDKPVSARVVFINDRPVKVTLNLLDTGDHPYDFFTWSSIADIPWGAGEPIKIMWAQRIINAVWRQMMDNAGDSSGGNLAIMGLEPEDDIWEVTGKKLWKWDGETQIDDIRKAITQVQLENNQAPLQAILELTLKFIDLMTATPTIFQGEMKETPDTLGATNIVVDSSNVTFRSKLKRWDDTITTPHLRRWYDYEMQYHLDDSIKEDLDVDPRGASVLYEKDQMRAQLLQIFALKPTDPDIQRKTDWDKAIELFYSSSHLDILKDEEPKQPGQEGQEGQPPNAEQQKASAEMEVAKVKIDGEMQKEMMRQEASRQEQQFKAEQAQLDREHQAKMKEYDFQIKMMEYSEKKDIEISKLKAQLAMSAESMNMQWAMQKHNEIREDTKTAVPEVSKPAVEPAGRAPVGESYPR